ncbi:MAG TPA: hypothetical protein VF548_14105 [Allosphingosinicella sp.]|jgi:hypothetical protein
MPGKWEEPAPADEAGRAGAAYLARNVLSNGRFRYLVDPATGRSGPGYNLLRHAGALMALGIWAGRLSEAEALPAMARSADFLLERVSKAGPGGRPCLVSKGRAKLGGSALLILALLEKDAALGSDRNFELCEGLADYLVSQQCASGAFASIHRIDGGEARPFHSDYYPGQAVLALLRFHAAAGSPRHLAAGLAGASHLLEREPLPLQPTDVADHWLIMALAAAHRFEERPLFLARALAGGERVMRQALRPAGDSSEVADPDYGCAPAATRGEALAAAARLALLAGDTAAAERFGRGLGGVVRFCLRHRWLQPGACLGGFSTSRSDRRIRVDTVQHAILAMDSLAGLLRR